MLPTQVSYWQNQESRRHNLAAEQVARQEADTSRINALTRQKEAETGRLNYEVGLVNALTSQTEAATRQAAQSTNEQRLQLEGQRLAMDREIGFANVGVAQKNAESTRIQATSMSQYHSATADKARVETEFIPYQAGSSVISNVVGAGSKVIPGVKNAAKGISTLVKNAVYNLRP